MTRGVAEKPAPCYEVPYAKNILIKKQRASLALTIDACQGRKGLLVAFYLY